MLKQIKKTTLCDEIIEQFKSQIVSGAWKPGDRIPTERSLTEMMGVSRTSLREAISAMAASGLLEVRPSEGIFIARDNSHAYKNFVATNLVLTNVDILHVLEARRLLEGQIVRLGVQRITESEIQAMEQLIAIMEERNRNGESFVEVDVDFHICLAQAAKNPILFEMVNTIRELMRSVHEWSLQFPERQLLAIEDHKNIVRWIRKRSPEGAQKAMEEHIDQLIENSKDATKVS